MLTVCKDSDGFLKCTEIKLESCLLLQSDSDSPLASGTVGRAACSPEFYPPASAAAPTNGECMKCSQSLKTPSHALPLPPNLI